MTTYLYEKDLRQMKYNILISTRHDLMVREIADRLGVGPNQVRLAMIRRFDMSLLENLPSRYEQGQKMADAGSRVAKELGCELFSRFIPFVEEERMQALCSEVRDMIDTGLPEEEAITTGKRRIREAILQ
ncbi:MAG: DUF1959 domain-containing protein [Methanomicrobiaceae archaeon]|uniref:Energy conserving hydrogenase eha protein m n=1 Tax=hydrocarbon metagenome TaxID=938273 RepID=A0A0W8FLA3_9ZZZZ|nr:DUF1959 domain-containing protein [Methanomicrobiaceae archaeon]